MPGPVAGAGQGLRDKRKTAPHSKWGQETHPPAPFSSGPPSSAGPPIRDALRRYADARIESWRASPRRGHAGRTRALRGERSESEARKVTLSPKASNLGSTAGLGLRTYFNIAKARRLTKDH